MYIDLDQSPAKLREAAVKMKVEWKGEVLKQYEDDIGKIESKVADKVKKLMTDEQQMH